jgi:hypothetical protein
MVTDRTLVAVGGRAKDLICGKDLQRQRVIVFEASGEMQDSQKAEHCC